MISGATTGAITDLNSLITAFNDLSSRFDDHATGDIGRWTTVEQLNERVSDIETRETEEDKNITLVEGAPIDIEGAATSGGYVVDATLYPNGGIVKFDLYAVLLSFGEVDVNGPSQSVTKSAKGLALVEILPSSIKVYPNDVITSTTIGVDNLLFYPYVEG